MDNLRITLLQTDICWESPETNLRQLEQALEPLCGLTDLVILPEMFSTGFSMQPEQWAEPVEGSTICTLQQLSVRYRMALAGSYIACSTPAAPSESEPVRYFNRAFFLTPEGECGFYDKHHLFRMGQEAEHYTAGTERPIFTYRGWHILLLVCYDLRFPVWSRNVDNAYDLLIYVANWPAVRRQAWDILLPARAIENLCYVAGVNRTGSDDYGLIYNGGSILCSPRGETLIQVPDGTEGAATTHVSLNSLHRFREKFPAWKDADRFYL